MRTYEEISLLDLIDETFGPIEFVVDRVLFHEVSPRIRRLLYSPLVPEYTGDRKEVLKDELIPE